MLRFALIAFCLAGLVPASLPLWAQADPRLPEIISDQLGHFEAGILCAPPTTGVQEAPDTVAGTTHIVDEAPEFVSHGRAVPAVIGVGFGAVAGFKQGIGIDGVQMRVTHPPFADSGATEQSFETWVGPAADPGVTFYQFDYTYELAVGDWVLEARLGDEVLYRLNFTVVPPEMLPDLAGICGYEHLIG